MQLFAVELAVWFVSPKVANVVRNLQETRMRQKFVGFLKSLFHFKLKIMFLEVFDLLSTNLMSI